MRLRREPASLSIVRDLNKHASGGYLESTVGALLHHDSDAGPDGLRVTQPLPMIRELGGIQSGRKETFVSVCPNFDDLCGNAALYHPGLLKTEKWAQKTLEIDSLTHRSVRPRIPRHRPRSELQHALLWASIPPGAGIPNGVWEISSSRVQDQRRTLWR